jgi:hypothetical protein
MQAASTEAFQVSTPGVPEPVSRTLHIQVAKVVTAHAASVGDSLLGVPLLCSAGPFAAPSLSPLCWPSHLLDVDEEGSGLII